MKAVPNIDELGEKYKLTNKEKVILEALLAGSDPKEIAYNLNNSYNTVLTHQKNLYRKLEVSSLRQLFVKFQPANGAAPPSFAEKIRKILSRKFLIPAAAVFVLALIGYFTLVWLPLRENGYLAAFDIWVAINDDNSTAALSTTTEIINGRAEDCITISGALFDDPNFLMTDYGYYGWNAPFSGVFGDPDDAANKILPKMKSISLKVLGDGGEYFFRLATSQTHEGDHWLYVFPTVKGETTTVKFNVPDDLVRLGWSEKDVEFIQKNIVLFQIQAVRPGPYHLKFWDIRLFK